MDDEQRRREHQHLEKIEGLIASCAARVEQQHQRVEHLKRTGRGTAGMAQETLEAMEVTLDTLKATRETIKSTIQRLG